MDEIKKILFFLIKHILKTIIYRTKMLIKVQFYVRFKIIIKKIQIVLTIYRFFMYEVFFVKSASFLKIIDQISVLLEISLCTLFSDF